MRLNLEAFLDLAGAGDVKGFLSASNRCPVGFLAVTVLGDLSQPPQPPEQGLQPTNQ